MQAVRLPSCCFEQIQIDVRWDWLRTLASACSVSAACQACSHFHSRQQSTPRNCKCNAHVSAMLMHCALPTLTVPCSSSPAVPAVPSDVTSRGRLPRLTGTKARFPAALLPAPSLSRSLLNQASPNISTGGMSSRQPTSSVPGRRRFAAAATAARLARRFMLVVKYARDLAISHQDY